MSAVRPLKIVHVTATPVGAPWMVALMFEQQRAGHDVAAILPSLDGDITERLAARGIPAYATGVDVVFANLSLAKRVAALVRLVVLLRRLRPDVVHSHIFNSLVTARLASWIADVPIHLGGNVHPYSIESPLLRPLEIGTAFCDSTSIASCSHTRDLLRRYGVPEDKIALIYYAVDQSRHDPALTDGARVRDELGISGQAPVIGKVAYFYGPANTPGLFPRRFRGRGMKGHDVLLRAIPRVLAEFPDAKFVLVGKGWGPTGEAYEKELKQLAITLGVGHAAIFPGERSDIPDVLAAFDVSVQCSLSDNLAGTVESLLMERPLVVSDIPGFADVVLHEKTGLVVPMDEPAALADAIVRLLRDRSFARELARNGRRRAMEEFSLAVNAERMERLLAAKTERAKRHYRLAVTMARVLALPVRLFRPMRMFWRACRAEGLSLRRLVPHLLKRVFGLLLAVPRRVRLAAKT